MRLFSGKTETALVVAFDSTASAFAFSDAAGPAGIEGRLVPTPRSLSAGCGMAWRGAPSSRESVESLLAAEGIDDARIALLQLK